MSWSFLFTLGAALGVVFGLTNILVAALSPFMEDTPLALLSFYGPMFVAWGVTGREAFRRTRRVGHFDSFRAYANYVYLTGAPFKIAVAATIGTVSGLIGGMMGVSDRGPAAQRP